MPNSMMRSYSLTFFFALMLAVTLCVAASQRKRNAHSAPQLYARHCASCHGNDGKSKTSKGKFSHARDLTDVAWHDDV
ncbi:MAG TPA: c-type cytochrome, partial [Pyrinomonadaceae bacterium]|nr:c-type cytochrome [Pyrinomonadaceae bacterium]